MSGAVAARGLRAAANPKAEALLRTLKGFFTSRDDLDEATLNFMPTNGAAAFDDVGGGADLRQDLDTAADFDAQLGALYARAPAAKEALDGFCRRVVTDAGLDPDKEMFREVRDGHVDDVFHAYSAAPLKGRVRAAEKAKNEYDGDAARLVDVVRASIVCADEASLVAVLKRILEDSDEACEVVRSKNRFRRALFNGYRDVLVNLRLRLPDGTFMVVELQIHLVHLFEFKAKSHVFYENFRTYFLGGGDVVAERMEILKSISEDAAAGLADAVECAVAKRDASKLKALDDLLEELAEYDFLAIVRECRRDMALQAEDSAEHSDALNKLQVQGKQTEALDCRKTEEKHHPQVANSLFNLAGQLEDEGELEAAEPLYRRDLELSEKELGPDHPNVAVTLANIASLLQAQGKFDAAEPLYRRALEISERHLGPDHPEIAGPLCNLAGLLEDQGNLDAAELLYRRDLAISEKSLGSDHPAVSTSLNNLALLLQAQGKHECAEPLFRRALEIGNQPEDASLLDAVDDYGEYEDDAGYEPLDCREKVGCPGAATPHVALLQAQGKYDTDVERQPGPDAGAAQQNLALPLLGRLDAALPL